VLINHLFASSARDENRVFARWLRLEYVSYSDRIPKINTSYGATCVTTCFVRRANNKKAIFYVKHVVQRVRNNSVTKCKLKLSC